MGRLKSTKPPASRPALLYHVAALHFEAKRSKTAIAHELGVSVTQVARLLRAASSEGIVQISVTPPRHIALERQLAERLSLREVRVVSAGSDEAARRAQLGREAARCFMDLATGGARIGIGSGRTMYELVSALPHRPSAVELFPVALIADESAEVRSIDAMTLVTLAWFKLRPDARALRMALTFPGVSLEKVRAIRETLFDAGLREDLDRYFASADALFFSASQPRKESQIVEITSRFGIGVRDLAERGVVGDILFRPVDENGKAVDVELEPFISSVPLEILKAQAAHRSKAVVLVAGGAEKVPVIHAALRASYCNTLITDDETAQLLAATFGEFETPPPPSRPGRGRRSG